MKTKIFSLLFAITVIVNMLYAEKVQVGDLYYNIDASTLTAEVTFKDRFDDVNYGNIKSVTIPQSVTKSGKTYSVTAIGDNAFVHCVQLATVVIPSSVKSIGGNAFGYCSSLSSITIPESVEKIGGCAFYDCSSLTSIVLPDNLKELEGGVFMKCVQLGAVNIPNKVTTIGPGAFWGCWFLSKITLPDGVKTVESTAFKNCLSLQEISIGANVAYFGSDAFLDCSNLQKINISNLRRWLTTDFANEKGNPLYYAKHLYLDNSEVVDLTIPADVQTIHERVFIKGVFNTVTIPHTVDTIGKDAFADGQINSVNTDDLTHWYNIYFANEKSNPISCSRKLLLNNIEVKELNIPVQVTTIGQYAFYGDELLEKVIVPQHVENIESGSFGSCSKLDSAIIEHIDTTCVVGTSAFPFRTKVVLQCGNLSKFNEYSNWKSYSLCTLHPFEITCTKNIEEAGKITIVQDCENVTLSAEANENYIFIKWSDGVTDEIREIVLTNDLSLEAEFASTEALGQITNDELPTTTKILRNGQIFILRGDKVYTLQGQEVR